MVPPTMEELSLEEPEIVKQGGRFGVRLRASAPSLHLIRADIETEVSPIVGTEKQSEELIRYLLDEFEGDPSKLWASNIFGKSLHELVTEGTFQQADQNAGGCPVQDTGNPAENHQRGQRWFDLHHSLKLQFLHNWFYCSDRERTVSWGIELPVFFFSRTYRRMAAAARIKSNA
jgi:hypothetical protein